MASNGSQADNNIWEKRYLEQERRLESSHADAELLSKLVQRIVAVTQGIDQEFDKQSDALSESLKTYPENSSFTGLARTIEGSVLKVLQRRDDGIRLFHGSFTKLIRQMDGLVEDVSLQEKFDQLKSELPDSVEFYYEYPRILSLLARAQGHFIDLMRADAGVVGSALTDTGESVKASEVDSGEDKMTICRHLASLLLHMLDQLTIPKDLLTEARQLRITIETGVNWIDMERLLNEAIDFAVKVTVHKREDFETYLRSLNGQLEDIQSFLGESRDHQQEAKESSRNLDQVLREDVAKVEDSLVRYGDLDQLKLSVRKQLSGILDAVDHYRDEEAAREDKSEQRLLELQSKIAEMEGKASELQDHLDEQRLRAMSDPLTGLPNRASYDERVREQISWAHSNNKELSLVVCDLDLFKAVNDSYGHLAGDKVLRLVAKILDNGIRNQDFIGRYGGEEFVIMLPETNASQTLEIMDKLRFKMEQSPFNFKGQRVQVTMSFGISELQPGDQADALFSRADGALYQAKENGRNRCCLAAN